MFHCNDSRQWNKMLSLRQYFYFSKYYLIQCLIISVDCIKYEWYKLEILSMCLQTTIQGVLWYCSLLVLFVSHIVRFWHAQYDRKQRTIPEKKEKNGLVSHIERLQNFFIRLLFAEQYHSITCIRMHLNCAQCTITRRILGLKLVQMYCELNVSKWWTKYHDETRCMLKRYSNVESQNVMLKGMFCR